MMQIDAIHRKEAMKAMTETFYAAIFGYDEVRQRILNLLFYSRDSNSTQRQLEIGFE